MESSGAPRGRVRVAPAPLSAEDFTAALESRYAVETARTNTDGSAPVSPGRFEIRGDLTPEAARDPQVVAAGPRAIAERFLAEEASALGLVDLEDLEEVEAETGPTGRSVVTFHRRIGGLRLADAVIQLEIDEGGRIERVAGNLPPVEREVYDAVSRPVLTREEVLAIAAAELAAAGRDPNVEKHLDLLAVGESPYVIWRVRSDVILEIDAATGEVLKRREGRRE